MNDIERAIEALKMDNELNRCAYKANLLAISVLEKQIPKQINIKINEFKAEDGYCPNCNERIEVAVWASEYCYECGQKLDWSTEE